MIALAAIRLPMAEGVHLLLAPENEPAPEAGLEPLSFLPRGWEGRRATRRSPIVYDTSGASNGMRPLRLVEIASFHWELQVAAGSPAADYDLHSSLSNSTAGSQWHARRSGGRLSGDFRFTVYLGTAWFQLTCRGRPVPERMLFEVITEKIDYTQEYRAMVKAISDRCSQLLLDWGTPTSLNIASNPSAPVQTLLEQFLFLRHVLGAEQLALYLELVFRRPHSTLRCERGWQAAAAAPPAGFGRDPLRFGRGWAESPGSGGMVAGFNAREVLAERKHDSLDTPPNRFLKFALQTFRGVCEEVMGVTLQNPDTGRTVVLRDEQGAAWQEALQMRDTLDACLAAPFFAEIGPLRRVPLESQTLQKRAGYHEILHAWLMLEAAAQIDWPGRSDAYDGTNRDVAALYEFWLYFVLFGLFQDQLGMKPIGHAAGNANGPLPFCCKRTDGGLRINLKQNEESFCRFLWSRGEHALLVHLFYNRQFSAESPVLERGSYSKSFRPDYTVVVLPAEYAPLDWEDSERRAESDGRISYLHFDAKYRVDKLGDLFGSSVETAAARQEAKTTGTVKNADLYKMHTYNEAIRRTAGSFVLYPGADAAPHYQAGGSSPNVYRRYHEIVPGIGAFALKPGHGGGDQGVCGLACLQSFFEDFLAHQLSKFTQHYRLNYWTESTIRDAPVDRDPSLADLQFPGKPPKDTQVLLGFVRGDPESEDCRKASVFYCHAVEWQHRASDPKPSHPVPGTPTDLDFDPFRSDLFVAYHQNTSAAWMAEVRDVKLVHANERARELGASPESMHAAYYYRFQLEAIQAIAPRAVDRLVSKRPGKPVARPLTEFAACPIAGSPS